MEKAHKVFSIAFARVCKLKEFQRFGVNSFVQTIRGSFVQQIEQAKDALIMEEVIKFFGTAFGHVCAVISIDRHKTPTCEGHMFSLSLKMKDLEGSE